MSRPNCLTTPQAAMWAKHRLPLKYPRKDTCVSPHDSALPKVRPKRSGRANPPKMVNRK